MRDMRRQKASGDLMDMVWWFSGGKKLGASLRQRLTSRPGIGDILFAMGRRDSALLLWLVFALLRRAGAGADHGGDHRAGLVRRQRRPAGGRARPAGRPGERR